MAIAWKAMLQCLSRCHFLFETLHREAVSAAIVADSFIALTLPHDASNLSERLDDTAATGLDGLYSPSAVPPEKGVPI